MAATTILNGFGISLGDGVIGLQALHAARRVGAVTGRVLLARREPAAKPLVPLLYRLVGDLAEVVPLEAAPAGGRIIDIRDFAFDPLFAVLPMIDFFLTRLGLDPARVPPALRRISWLAPAAGPLPSPMLPRDYVLLCPRASIALRDMPEPVHTALVARLRARGWGPIVTQGPALPGAVAAPACATIEALCALVAGARCIVSTDTAMVHLADAFSVPCLAFFTTHKPELRVRDYPLCRALRLPVAGLPESIEFVRDDADLVAVRQAWFPDGPSLRWLDRALDTFVPA